MRPFFNRIESTVLLHVFLFLSIFQSEEDGEADTKKENVKSGVCNGLCRLDGSRIERHFDDMLASRNRHGTKHIVGTEDVGWHTVNLRRPSWIVDFGEDCQAISIRL